MVKFSRIIPSDINSPGFDEKSFCVIKKSLCPKISAILALKSLTFCFTRNWKEVLITGSEKSFLNIAASNFFYSLEGISVLIRQ